MNYRIVDYDMIELLNMEIKKGRSFSRTFDTKSSTVILNETAVKTMGLKDPVGKTMEIWDDRYEIIGVVKDFYFESIQAGKVKPMFILKDMGRLNTIMVKVAGKELDKTINTIRDFHTRFNPGYPFAYRFLDQDFQKLYSTEQKMSALSGCFSSLAILISCLGLFGLTAFTVNKRKKELSVRKVLGASEIEIILLLYKSISKLVVISLLIGLPVGYIITSSWLNSFAERISVGPWMFIMAGGISFALMLIASGIQIFKTLSINPATSLRAD
jgi:ABC-type antimicrobial peptide transport system permease subunit